MAFPLAHVQPLSPHISISKLCNNNKLLFRRIPKVMFACHQNSGYEEETKNVHRRNVTFGLGGALLALGIHEKSANAAGKRPPPPPPKEKQDLSMTALQAKIMANKRRKEALKEEVARLRERGKPATNRSE